MNLERERRAAELFEELVDLDGPRRSAALRAACGGDEAMRQAVEILFAADAAPESPSTTSWPATAPADELAAPLGAGAWVGRCRIRRLIAAGGMGAVYEAEQEHPRRVVALKLVRRGVASPDAMRRFQREASTLARLRHPAIARVFDAGVHDDGTGPVPWISMELVPDAQTIVEHANTRGLGLNERLELFRQLCDAVQHGHERGVIHRDLKPANILVDAAGAVTVIDFGIARAIDGDCGATVCTAPGQVLGTLQYMAPEQVQAGGAVDERTDVYALGVVLYELLCGRPPLDLGDADVLEAVRMIREQEPERPSARSRALRGDLEAIIGRAMDKDRTRRYASAAELRQDIDRHLAGLPVAAQPRTRLVLLRSFARRHRGLVASVALVFFVLVAALAAVSTLAVRLQRYAERRDEVNAILESVIMRLDANPYWIEGRVGRQYGVDTRLMDVFDDVLAELDAHPLLDREAEATIRYRIGRGYNWAGRYDEAAAALTAARELLRRELGPGHPSTLSAQAALAFSKVFLFDSYEAANLAAEAVEGLRAVLGPAHPHTLEAMTTLMLACNYAGFMDELERTAREAIALAGDEPGMRVLRATARGFLAMCHRSLGRLDVAEREAQAIVAELEPEQFGLVIEGQAHIVMALCALDRGELDRAEAEVRRGIELWDARTAQGMLEFHVVLAEILVRQGRHEEGLALARQSIDVARRRHGPHHPYATLIARNSARVTAIAGDDDGTLELYEEIAESLERGPQNPLIRHAFNMHGFANVLNQCGRTDDACEALRRAVEFADRVPDAVWDRTIFRRIDFVDACVPWAARLGCMAEARAWNERVLSEAAAPTDRQPRPPIVASGRQGSQ